MIKKILMTLVILMNICAVCFGYTVYGTVTKVSDGDTFKIALEDGSEARVRMACIDAPESKQEYGNQSTEALRGLIGDSRVMLDVQNTDMYGRMVSLVKIGSIDVNGYMIANGFAWHYKAYDKTGYYDYYEMLEENARNSELGIWAINNPLPPWEYRKMKKKGQL